MIMIGELKDDNIKWNASRAINGLRASRAVATEPLMKALESDDWQTRQAAAVILSQDANVKPTPQLIKVLVEGLRADALPRENREGRDKRYTMIFNAKSSMLALIRYGREAREQVAAALDSDDLQQRFLAAVILGFARQQSESQRVAEILIPHLKDNRIESDAVMAACALYRMGGPIRPYVEAALRNAPDSQSRGLLRLILLDLKEPPINNNDYARRKGMQTAVKGIHDPVAWLTPYQFSLRWGDSMTVENRDTPSEQK
jgi:hypothetical protein